MRNYNGFWFGLRIGFYAALVILWIGGIFSASRGEVSQTLQPQKSECMEDIPGFSENITLESGESYSVKATLPDGTELNTQIAGPATILVKANTKADNKATAERTFTNDEIMFRLADHRAAKKLLMDRLSGLTQRIAAGTVSRDDIFDLAADTDNFVKKTSLLCHDLSFNSEMPVPDSGIFMNEVSLDEASARDVVAMLDGILSDWDAHPSFSKK